MRLHLHIDRLVMDADARHDSEALAEAIRAELGANISRDGLPAQLQSGGMRPEGTASEPAQDGIGGAIYRSLNS